MKKLGSCQNEKKNLICTRTTFRTSLICINKSYIILKTYSDYLVGKNQICNVLLMAVMVLLHLITLVPPALYSQVLISGRIQLSNCLFSLEPDFDIQTINLWLEIRIFGPDIKVYIKAYQIGAPYRVA
jgi:hypothetical protein